LTKEGLSSPRKQQKQQPGERGAKLQFCRTGSTGGTARDILEEADKAMILYLEV
jgi:hypothetical protein